MLILLIITLFLCLMSGYPVAFVLGGVSLIFALLGILNGNFDPTYLMALPNRIFGIMQNDLLIAVPLFVFMGNVLEKAKIAEELLTDMAGIFGRMKAGLGISVMFVGVLLAASTGIVGATVVTMGLISLPVMLKTGYDTRIATGTICAAGTLGQIIPPSIVLILLGDQISSAHQATMLKIGNLNSSPVSIADLFVGAILPGFLLVLLYIIWLIVYGKLHPHKLKHVKPSGKSFKQILKTLVPPLALIILVLGSILSGIATATESASIGAIGALILSGIKRKNTKRNLTEIVRSTTKVTSMVFTILIGAAMFTIVFRGFGGDDAVHHLFTNMPGGLFSAMLISMVIIFLLGFFLDFIEIIYVVVPIIAPVLLLLGADPIWLAVMIAVNLQTSFLTPPFGFALFYLRGVAPKSVLSSDIYKGIVPFVMLQILALFILAAFPKIITYLPEKLYGTKIEAAEPVQGKINVESGYGVDF